MINPTKEEIQRVSEVCKINSRIFLQVLVEKGISKSEKNCKVEL